MERLDTRSSSDRLQLALHNQRYDFVLRNLSRLDSVLEIGTGQGNLSALLAARCGNFLGLDFDPGACRVASHRLGPGYRVVLGDARMLPFEARSFSAIVCLEVLEHLGDYVAGIRNIHRCLRPDGMAILSVPFRRHGGKSATNPYHLYEPGRRQLTASLHQYFAQVRVCYQYFHETALMQAARWFHLRRLLGLAAIYRALAQGEPQALSRLKIGPKPFGMSMHLIIVVERPRLENQTGVCI